MEQCFYECGREATTDDHIIVASRGGADHPRNYVRACAKCNNERDDLSIEEFARQRGLTKPLPRGLTRIELVLTTHSTNKLTIVVCLHCQTPTVAVRPQKGAEVRRYCSDSHRKKYNRKLSRERKRLASEAAIW